MGAQDYEILGRSHSAHAIGATIGAAPDVPKSGAFNWGTLIDAGAEAAQQGLQYKQNQDAAAANAGAQSVKAQKAIAADVAWANAEVQLAMAQKAGNAQAVTAAQNIASTMANASATAGAGLTGDYADKRITAAQNAANSAAQASLAAPNDATAAARMQAWQKVLAGVMAGGSGTTALVPGSGPMPKYEGKGGNPLTKKLGGVPVWGWGAAGVGVVGLLVFMIRRKK